MRNVILPLELVAYHWRVGDVVYVPHGWVNYVRWLNRDTKGLFIRLWRGGIGCV